MRSWLSGSTRVEELTGTCLGVDEVRRFMREMGMKPRKTGHMPAKADDKALVQTVQETLLPLLEEAQGGKCRLFFMDAAHFVPQPFVGTLWCFARLFVKAAAGRNRINVLGAPNAVSRKLETVANTAHVNSETVGDLLKKLAQACKRLFKNPHLI